MGQLLDINTGDKPRPSATRRPDLKKSFDAAVTKTWEASRDGNEEDFIDALKGAIRLGGLVDREV